MGVFCTQTKINPILETLPRLVPTQEALQLLPPPHDGDSPAPPAWYKGVGDKSNIGAPIDKLKTDLN